MAGSSKAGSSSHATESLAERFDHSVANAVFFLEPEPGGNQPSEALPLVTYELCSTPSSSAAAWYSDLVDLIRDRARPGRDQGKLRPRVCGALQGTVLEGELVGRFEIL